ncbi:MAG: FecR family protein [Tannerellaceae bacterium]|nr:FecR family protein [Tannerellaceae bacterium]
MSSKDKQMIRTGQAWERLFNRLDEEGLIPAQTAASSPWLRRRGWQWAAAVWLIGCGLTFLFYKPSPESDINLVTLKNDQTTSTLVATLEDGSIIYLADNAELTYPESFEEQKREVTLRGNALFDVTGNKKRPFIIHTLYTDVEVIGTSFEIKSTDKENFQLSVLEGEVKVTLSNSQKEIFIRAGEAITVTPTGEWQYGSTISSAILQKMTYSLRFRNEYVEDIIRVINKNQPEITFEVNSSLAKHQLSVTFTGQTAEEMAEILSETLNAKYKKENDLISIINK